MTLSNPAQYISGRTVQEQMNSLIDYVDQRAADVALDAIASDVAQVHQDMLDADADATAAAASAAAAAGTLANAVKKTGEASQSIEGDVSLSTGDLSVAGDAAVQGQLSVIGGCDLRAPVKIPVTPTNNDDAASKKYVDDSLDNYAPMVRDTGNKTIDGIKTFTKPIVGTFYPTFYVTSGTNAGKWVRIAEVSTGMLNFQGVIYSDNYFMEIVGSSQGIGYHYHAVSGTTPNVALTIDSDKITFWLQYTNNYRRSYGKIIALRYANVLSITQPVDQTVADAPTGDTVLMGVEL